MTVKCSKMQGHAGDRKRKTRNEGEMNGKGPTYEGGMQETEGTQKTAKGK